MALYLPNLPMFSHTKIFPYTDGTCGHHNHSKLCLWLYLQLLPYPTHPCLFHSSPIFLGPKLLHSSRIVKNFQKLPISVFQQLYKIKQITKKALHHLTNMANTKVRFVFLLQFNISQWCFPKCKLCGFLIRRSHLSFGNLLFHCIQLYSCLIGL